MKNPMSKYFNQDSELHFSFFLKAGVGSFFKKILSAYQLNLSNISIITTILSKLQIKVVGSDEWECCHLKKAK